MSKIFFVLDAPPRVAVVILNWNGSAFLRQFLPSVLATTYPNYTIIVADNASTDDSLTFLNAHYPQVGVMALPENLGFAKGYNAVLKKIEADYFVLLNSDVEVASGWLQPMIALLEQDKMYAACQPKVLSYDHEELFEYAGAAGGWIDRFGYPFARGRVFDVCEVDNGQYNSTQPIFWASGAALVIRKDAFHAVHGFDDAFFAHQEEIDLCWRLQLQGYKIFCCPDAVVYHVGGGTLPRGHSRKTFLNFRNNLMMLVKNLHRSERWKIPFRLVLDLVSAFKGLLSGDGGYFVTILKAHMAFYKWLLAGEIKRTPGRKKMRSLAGVYRHNIVWQYFVRKKRTFSAIVTSTEKN